MISSQIQPVCCLGHQRAISDFKWLRVVIICIDQKKIGHWRKSPLKAGVDIDIFHLVVVLQENSKEEAAAKSEVNAGAVGKLIVQHFRRKSPMVKSLSVPSVIRRSQVIIQARHPVEESQNCRRGRHFPEKTAVFRENAPQNGPDDDLLIDLNLRTARALVRCPRGSTPRSAELAGRQTNRVLPPGRQSR